VTLNSPPDPASLNTDNFRVNSDFIPSVQGTFQDHGNTFDFFPDQGFWPGEIITASITDGVTVMGQPVSPYIWQLRTETASAAAEFEKYDQGFNNNGWARDADIGDLDNDGDLDILFGNSATRGKVYLNDGTGVMTLGDSNLQSVDCLAVELGDLDHDGDLDFFFVADDEHLGVWFNAGDGTFSNSGQVLGFELDNKEVELGDLDGDGDLDAFISRYGRNQILLNEGDGFFTSYALLTECSSADTDLGDLDLDGDLDAFVVNSYGPCKVWFNDGQANFTDSGQEFSSGRATISVELGDLDGDGDLDAFLGSDQFKANKVFFNDGTGVFVTSGQKIGNLSTQHVDLGDLDGDGDLDAVSSNYISSNAIWLNDGYGNFDRGQAFPSSSSRATCLGDMDMDGDLDILDVNFGGENSQVWFNQAEALPSVVFGDSECNLTTEQAPFNTEKAFSEVQYCIPSDYLNAEFTRPVLLSKIGWWLCSGYISSYATSVDIHLDMIPESECPLFGPDGFEPNGTLVWSGQISAQLTGIHSFEMDTPFYYEPGNCLLITICEWSEASGMASSFAANDLPSVGVYGGKEVPPAFDCDLTTNNHTVLDNWPSTFFSYELVPCNRDGDINLDGSITAADAQTAFMIAVGAFLPSYEEDCAADCNGDDMVTAGDAQSIFMTAIGLNICVDSM